jgi:Protein of unknown function (DUF4100)/Aspartyl protease
MRERLDNYQELMAKPPFIRDPPPHVSAALYEIAPDTEVMQIEVTREIEDPDLARLSVLQAEMKKVEDKIKKGKKTVRFDGVEMPPAPTWAKKPTSKPGPPPMVPISMTPPTDPASTPSPSSSSSTPSTSSLPSAAPSTSTKPSPSSSTTFPRDVPRLKDIAPQYRYQAAVEDPSIAQVLLDRALDSTIQITPRELLATSPELRKQLKEMVVSKKVSNNVSILLPDSPVHAADSFLHENAARYDEDTVAASSLPLRVVYPDFGHGVQPECILDSGAQIIAMRRDVWERLDLPLLCEKVMVMESANNTRNHTLGLVQNVRVSFGPVSFSLQIQVVDDAPFEVLLGRPFFALASCLTEDTTSGDTYITLTDPNTGQRAKFNTYPRTRRLTHIHQVPTTSTTGFP